MKLRESSFAVLRSESSAPCHLIQAFDRSGRPNSRRPSRSMWTTNNSAASVLAPAAVPLRGSPGPIRGRLSYVFSHPFLYLRRRLTLADADRRARHCPPEATRSLVKLTAYLTRDFPELLAVRATYSWITSNIEYDWDSYRNPKRRKPQDAETVLKNRMGVCAGFSSLFDTLLTLASIHSFYLLGVIKYELGSELEPHAWSAARIDGKYHLFDVTWGDGGWHEKYFLASPHVMRPTHFPEDPAWQLLEPILTLDAFKRI